MKKHNESKSIKGIRRSKGKILCKVISFTMIFVMLFCISAYAETETIEVYNQTTGKYESISVTLDIKTTEVSLRKTYTINEPYILVSASDMDRRLIYSLEENGITYEEQISMTYQINRNRIIIQVITSNASEILENFPILYNVSYYNNDELMWNVQSIDISVSGEKSAQVEEILRNVSNSMLKPETFTPQQVNVTEIEPPVYEGFIGNARGLFDMLFESIQSIFNWLVSPNVIVFFGLGIILSLTTIGILIARRFFWGR